jgi:hypothetical protein
MIEFDEGIGNPDRTKSIEVNINYLKSTTIAPLIQCLLSEFQLPDLNLNSKISGDSDKITSYRSGTGTEKVTEGLQIQVLKMVNHNIYTLIIGIMTSIIYFETGLLLTLFGSPQYIIKLQELESLDSQG